MGNLAGNVHRHVRSKINVSTYFASILAAACADQARPIYAHPEGGQGAPTGLAFTNLSP